MICALVYLFLVFVSYTLGLEYRNVNIKCSRMEVLSLFNNYKKATTSLAHMICKIGF